MGKEGFKGLKVWEKGKDLAVFIYRVTERGSFSKDYSFKDQIRRAAISIPSNIAEGDALGSDKQAARYLHIAKGSTAEVMTQANIAFEVGHLDQSSFNEIEKRCAEIIRMLHGLISAKDKG